MKKFIVLFFITLGFYSCSNSDENVAVTLKFTQNWNETTVTNQDFNAFKFTTKNGETVSIVRLRYLISNLSLQGEENYFLVDVGENSGNLITISDIAPGIYNLNFRFGFSDLDNQDGIYQDLNSVNFGVPGMLGGGYHYMQFDGKYKDTNNQDANFNYHAIRAVDRSNPNNLVFEDTSFLVNLGTVEIKNNTTIEIKMNIAEWFKNPNTWNLNQLNTVLMPNFDAQKLISANGKTVFSLGTINQ
ncbi:MbnP family protein [Polaribacter septentrionalilitoris]|uniref:MbnP family protein n=1 Tax=Polaribacter septentrionalilitoris TaxID=2494657 RepID=UPI001358C015|nr:MbnP family protein [Polaribacter septentrionalilitoris]